MRNMLLATVAGTLAVVSHAHADSLTPATFTGSTTVGGTISINNKVGTITSGSPTTAQADVLFLTDTTGSMGPAIASIQSAFSSTVTSLAALGNIATGAAEYKDVSDAFTYRLDQAITTNSALTKTAINNLAAGGGGDDPEQGLYALTQASGSSTGFRAGSKDIIVLTGDAPSHDVSNPPAAGGATVANTAAALTAAGITVEALNASNITGDSGLNSFGQFSGAGSIFAAGVSGTYTSTFPSAASLTSLLTSLIGSAFMSYSTVSLNLVGPAPTACSVSLPSSITGSFDRTISRTFNFGAVGVTGLSSGTCAFTVALEADGAILATESDSVTIGAVPEPATIALLGTALLGLGTLGSRRRF